MQLISSAVPQKPCCGPLLDSMMAGIIQPTSHELWLSLTHPMGERHLVSLGLRYNTENSCADIMTSVVLSKKLKTAHCHSREKKKTLGSHRISQRIPENKGSF